MTEAIFRRIVLSLPETTEGEHMGHPDFRVGGKIFATLGYPGAGWGMLKLHPEEQDEFLRANQKAFVPVKGAWGRQGCTNVKLAAITQKELRAASRAAWSKAAPRELLERQEPKI